MADDSTSTASDSEPTTPMRTSELASKPPVNDGFANSRPLPQNLEYISLGDLPAGQAEQSYFPPGEGQSLQVTAPPSYPPAPPPPSQARTPQPSTSGTSSSPSPSTKALGQAKTPQAQQALALLDSTTSTHVDRSQSTGGPDSSGISHGFRSVDKPGAAERLRIRLADHRKSTTAATSNQLEPDNTRDYAFREAPNPRGVSASLTDGSNKAYSRVAESALPAEDHNAPELSTKQRPSAHASTASTSQIPPAPGRNQSLLNSLFKRRGGRTPTLDKPTGRISPASNDDEANRTRRESVRTNQRKNSARLSDEARQEDPAEVQEGGFSLAGTPRKRTRTRTRTATQAPVGVAVPRGSVRREPSWVNAARNKPLYSLGKPLPTHEEVEAQKAWQEERERIKAKYPDAEPPEAPALPSQQATSTGGGLQLDREQLADVIRTVIAEFRAYELGDDSSHRLHQGRSFLSTSTTGARRSTASDATFASPTRNRFPGENLPRVDSSVIEDEDGPPLDSAPSVINRDEESQEAHGRIKRRSTAASSGRRAELPSIAEPASARAERAPSHPNFPPAGLPAKPEEPEVLQDTNASDEKPVAHSDNLEQSIRDGVLGDNDTQEAYSNGNMPEDEYEEDEGYPNFVAKLRVYAREPLAEFLGAMVLAIIGVGATAQANLSSNSYLVPAGTGQLANAGNIAVPLAWGAGVAMSVYIAGGISGGHISPAITIVLAVFRGFPWKRVPGYVISQLLGFLVGSGVAYALYADAISIYEGGSNVRTMGTGGTASFFATYPLQYVSNVNAWFQEFVNVAVLLVLVLAIGDADNVPPPAGLNPIIIMFMVMAIGLGLGIQSSNCLNPARDLGPRLVSWFAGYGVGVWDYRSQYWLWGPWLADITGGLFGAFLYDTLIYMGRESPMNKHWHTPGISNFGPAERLSRRWQVAKMRNKSKWGNWRSNVTGSKGGSEQTV